MGSLAEGGMGGFCSTGGHDDCDHQFGMSLRLLRRGERNFVLLCQCTCHQTCPLRGRDEVGEAVWDRDCVCPGAARTRERRAQREREAAQRQQLQAEILRDFDLGRGKAADEIQRELLAAYRAHGVEPPSDFGRVTRFMSAGSARRGTRTLRLVWELGSGLRALERWAGEHANDDEVGARIDASASAENRGQRRRLHAAVTGCVALAVAAAGAGWKTTGTVRVLFAVAAAVIAALSACVGLLDFVIGLLDRLVGVGSPRPPDGNGSS